MKNIKLSTDSYMIAKNKTVFNNLSTKNTVISLKLLTVYMFLDRYTFKIYNFNSMTKSMAFGPYNMNCYVYFIINRTIHEVSEVFLKEAS
jgi:hypothetical protein